MTELPNSLAQLRNLTSLMVNMNQLTALADLLGQLQNLKKLYVSGNPLSDPYPELNKRGAEAILTYLRSLAKEEETDRITKRSSSSLAKAASVRPASSVRSKPSRASKKRPSTRKVKRLTASRSVGSICRIPISPRPI